MRKSKLQNMSVINNTGARIIPQLVVGDYNGFTSGDILDANAIVQALEDGTIASGFNDEAKQKITDMENDIATLKTSTAKANTDATSALSKANTNATNIETLLQFKSDVEDLIGSQEDLDDVIDTYYEIVNFLDNVPSTTLNDITSAFLPKSGGTMTGNIAMGEGGIVITDRTLQNVMEISTPEDGTMLYANDNKLVEVGSDVVGSVVIVSKDGAYVAHYNPLNGAREDYEIFDKYNLNPVQSMTVNNIVTLTLAEYDALPIKDPYTEYNII